MLTFPHGSKGLMVLTVLVAVTLLVSAGYVVYLFNFKTLSDADIVAYGWKNGDSSCTLNADGSRLLLSDGTPVLGDVLDFRAPQVLSLRDGVLLRRGKPVAEISQRVYRVFANSYIEVRNLETGKLCTYFAKWRNV